MRRWSMSITLLAILVFGAVGVGADEPEQCWWVQVAAFSDRGNAARAELELERAGEDPVVLEGLDGLWRVRVGSLVDQHEAERARNRITDAWPGSHIVPCGG